MMNPDLIRNDPLMKELIENNHLSDSFLNSNQMMIMEVLEQRKKCQGCKGLEECIQDQQGLRPTLSYDQVLIRQIEYCPFGQLKRARKELFENYVYCDIPERLADLELEKVTYKPEQKELYFLLLAILLGESDKGLYINGQLGTGKTYLCTALANSLVKKGKKVAFVKVGNFINQLKSFYGYDEDLIGMYIRKLQKVTYLFLDDIGSESVSEFVRDDILFRILDYRMENKLLTIFTSNLDLDSLRKHYQYDRKEKENPMNALRLLERIEILSDYYVLTGKNYRRE